MSALDSLSPPAGREGTALTAAGSGFLASGNTATVDGLAATVTAESATSVTLTVPAGVRRDRFLEVVIQSGAASASRLWWSKPTLAELRAFSLGLQLPGAFEFATAQELDRCEAKDVELLHEALAAIHRDLLTGRGDMLGRGAARLERVAGGALLDRLARSDSAPAFQGSAGVTLLWGGQLNVTSERNLTVQRLASTTADGAGDDQGVPQAGRVAALWVWVDLVTTTDRLDRVRLLKNGSAVYDSGTGLNKGTDSIHVAHPWLSVAATDRLALACTKTGVAGTISLLGGVQVF